MLEAPDWAPLGEPVLHQLDREEGTADPRKIEEKDMEREIEDVVVTVMAILIAIGISGICFPDAIKKYKRYVWNKYNKKD